MVRKPIRRDVVSMKGKRGFLEVIGRKKNKVEVLQYIGRKKFTVPSSKLKIVARWSKSVEYD